MPFPDVANDQVDAGLRSKSNPKLPWKKTNPGEPPPIMLQLHFHDGKVNSYACSDIREMQKRDAGFLSLHVFGMEKYRITIEGRNLNDLFDLLQTGRIKRITEMGSRTFDHPENSPAIDKITVETLTGPSM